MFQSLGQYDKAKEYLQKALVITTKIGDRRGEASCHGNLGTVLQSLGQYDMAKEHLHKVLVIKTEIGDKEGETADLANLGVVSRTVGDSEASEVCLEKALSISRDIGDRRKEFQILQEHAILYLFQNKLKDSLLCLHLCIEKYEELRSFLGANDQFKTSFLEDSGIFPYKLLCTLLCVTGKTRDALYVEELGRARGLSDLMAEKYSVETHISANPQSWFGIEDISRKEDNCTCLYISYFQNDLHLWILKTSGVLHFKRISVEENLVQAGLPKDLPLSKLVGVPPLVDEKATKQAVLERISSVSLIHFAAHCNAERGEIALSPIPAPNGRNAILPQEAYMLTMADVSRVKIRAKLVVLSCSHSGSGEIRAEGVIGIARAFLGSGARSVLVALWAISDSATEQLMSRFYKHLVEGESAGESLHQAMKWMRKNGFTKVSEWASFTLIGDDVRLEFGKQR